MSHSTEPEPTSAPAAGAEAPDAWPDGEPTGVVDRRLGHDRRNKPRTGLEHVRGPGRRRTDFTRKAEEGEMTSEQFLFVMAIDAFKRVNRKNFPTWTEVLEVMRKLGYRKTAPSMLNLPNVEDWTERPDAPANVEKKQGDRDVDAEEQD